MQSSLSNLLSAFNLTPTQEILFEAALNNGTMTATQLARQVNISRTSVYDHLGRLLEHGLMTETTKNGIKAFAVEQPEKIDLLLNDRENKITMAKQSLELLKLNYYKIQANQKPRFQMFEGKAELQQMMRDLLLYPNITMRVYWPILDVIKLLGPDFIMEFNQARLKNRISLQTIWPHDQIPSLTKYPWLKIGIVDKREVRLAPQGINFSLGYSIYGNTVRFLSSSKENFGFLMTSKEFADTMKGNFDIMWESSKPFKF